jgi:hypothetical protein
MHQDKDSFEETRDFSQCSSFGREVYAECSWGEKKKK